MKETQDLGRFFNPSSLAIIGASKDDSKGGGRFLRGLIDKEFKGKLYPVNPREAELMGLKNYHSVLDIPGEIDLAIVTVPARTVPQVMAECSQKGVRFAVVHSAGFGELGAEGKALEKEMLKFAGQGGTRIIGPNCMGLYSPRARINTIASRTISEDESGSVAFVGQSGWVTENVIQLGYERGLRFSQVVSIGNQSDLTIEDLLAYFASDPNTKVMAFYAEGIKRGRDFLELARQIAKKKPVIAWKAGRSEVGIRAAASHTGSLAGNGVVLDAAMVQGGVAIARNLEELIDLMAGFTCPVLPKGNRLGLLVEAGGGAVASADAAEALGLVVPTLSSATQQELQEILTVLNLPLASPRNPVDLVWAPTNNATQLYMQCTRAIIKEVDAMVVISYLAYDDELVREMSSLMQATGKPILNVPGHVAERRDGMGLLTKKGVPAFTIPERAIKTLAAMLSYSNYRQ